MFRKKYENSVEKLDKNDLLFIEQLKTKNGSIRQPTESMMLPTDSLAELDDILKKNTTYCFKMEPGKTGWCATCRVGLGIYFRDLFLFPLSDRSQRKSDWFLWSDKKKLET